MSAQSKLEEFIRRLIQQELDEATSTASVGNDSYKTPFAFSDKRKKGKKKKKAGYDGGHTNPTVSTDNFHANDPKLRKEGKYHDFRNDDTLTAKQKIGMAMRESRDSLKNLEKTIDMNLRLKNELNVDSRDYWKNTHKALHRISERLVKLAGKVGQLR
jgi:hypothetical protein